MTKYCYYYYCYSGPVRSEGDGRNVCVPSCLIPCSFYMVVEGGVCRGVHQQTAVHGALVLHYSRPEDQTVLSSDLLVACCLPLE